ncbi:hypothetical protein P3X46_015135 [Hevea brasiliensis]|uniref:Beta-glucosidase n=1 Tax=Hevea brasiliensis TaxID=3981 RepID=A0ABQ9LWX4_HEVBR|nr:hypothetical protein P3X46_015135 [Hevea brasiliensis]
MMLRVYYLLIVLLNLVVAIFCADKYSREDFPSGFVFGSGTSAYQVEGAASEDGRSPGIWDTVSHEGKMDGATGDVSVDERGLVNPKAVLYYNNLISELISHGRTSQLMQMCVREFGDRVLHWTTLNEPNVFPLYSYDLGILPPYRCSSTFGLNCSQGNSASESYLVAHHLLLAHASAVRLYRKKYQIANPVVFGDYPETVKKNAGSRLPAFTIQESKQVKGSFDFLGIIHYVSIQVKDNSASLNSEHRDYRADMAAKMIWQRIRRTSSLEDASRVKYMNGYVGSVLDAIRGYFTWSLLDVFELMGCYETCFGLYCVDLSAHWYSQFLRGKPVGSDVFIQLGKHFPPLSDSS